MEQEACRGRAKDDRKGAREARPFDSDGITAYQSSRHSLRPEFGGASCPKLAVSPDIVGACSRMHA
jgi:hypothetical protein